MKVALVVPGFSSHERDWCIPALLDHVRVLAKTVELHVFAMRWPERRATYPVFGADVHALGGRKRLGPRVVSLWARALRAIAAEHRRAPFDVVHGFWADEPGWVAAWSGRRLGVPTIISLAGGELVGLPDIGYGLQSLTGRGWLVRWALKRAACVTAGSRYLITLARAHLPKSHWSKLTLAPLGVDTARFTPSPGCRPNQNPVVLNVGALYPVKGHALLLRAFSRVSAGRLQIVGDGPLKPSLQKLAAELNLLDRVEFLGDVAHEKLPELYRAASVFAQVSRHEAQGMALLEAAACAVPAVGTPVGILPEIGLTTCGEEDLACQLAELLQDPVRLENLGQAALAKVQHDLSAKTTVGRFIDLYTRHGRNSTEPQC